MVNITLMSFDEFEAWQRQFSDDYLCHVFHQWTYSEDSWGEFLCLFSNL